MVVIREAGCRNFDLRERAVNPVPMSYLMVLSVLAASLMASIAGATGANIGSDISSAVAQNLMGSPPLPSLEGGSVTLSPQYGYVEVKAVGEYSVNSVPYTYSGTTKGNTFGLSLSGSSKGGWGFFVYAGYSRIGGEVESASAAGEKGDGIMEIKAESTGAAAAITYRLIGTEKSTFALGVFTGPGYIGVKSSGVYDAHPPSGGATGQAKYEFNPTSTGAFSGVQLAWRLGDFLINPYLTVFASPSSVCQPMEYETISGEINDSYFQCMNQKKMLAVFPSFVSIGMFLGYKTFRFSLFSSTGTLETLEITNYSASIGIPF